MKKINAKNISLKMCNYKILQRQFSKDKFKKMNVQVKPSSNRNLNSELLFAY